MGRKADWAVRLGTTGSEEINATLGRVERQFDAVAGGFQGVTKALRGVGPGVGVAVAAVELGVRAVDAFARAVQRAGEEVIKLGQRGGQVSAVMRAWERAGGTVDRIERLRDATGGLVSDMEMLPRVTQIVRAGLVDFATAARMIGFTIRAAQDHAVDMTAALTQMTAVLTGGGLEEFARTMGVDLMSVRGELRDMGLSIDQTEGRLAGLEIIFERLDSTMGDADNQASNLGDAWRSLTVAGENFYDEVARQVAEDESLINFFQDLQQELEQSGVEAGDVANAIVEAIRAVILATRDLAQALITLARASARVYQAWQLTGEQLNVLGHAMDFLAGRDSALERGTTNVNEFMEGLDAVQGRLDDTASAFDRLADATSGFRSELRQTIDESARAPDALDDILDMIDTNESGDPVSRRQGEGAGINRTSMSRFRRGRRGGGGGRGRRGISQEAMIEELAAEAQIAREIADYREREARAAEVIKDHMAHIEEHDRARAEAVRRVAAAKQAVEEAEAESRQRAAMLERAAVEEQVAAYDKLESKLQSVATALSNTGAVFGQLANMVEQSAGRQSAAFKALAAVEGAFLVAYNVAMGVTEAAKAVSSWPIVWDMAMHATGSALHFAAAGVAAAELGAKLTSSAQSKGSSAGGGAGAGAASPHRPAHRPEWQGERERGGTDQQSGFVLVNNGVMTSEEAATEIDRMMAAKRRARAA